jgi:hypothetical protein
MSRSILDEFGMSAIGVPEFNDIHNEAMLLFDSANDLAGEGKIVEAVEKADKSIEALKPLGELSSALEEELRTINATKYTWITAGTDVTPHPEREGRPAMIYSMLIVVGIILVLAAYIYIVEPRRSPAEE